MTPDAAIFDGKEAAGFLKQLRKKIDQVEGADKVFQALASVKVFQDIDDHFKQEEGPDGAWTAWSDVYAEHMEAKGKSGNKILQDLGRLRGGILPIQKGKGSRKVAEGILWFNPQKTKGGFPYAAAHDEGGERLPQREFMWLSSRGLADLETVTLAFLLEEG